MKNMICEEIKEQWKGKIVGILIIIVFLFSISEGVLEVYNLKNLYNNIQKVVEDKKETDYGLIQYEQDEYNRKKESIYLQNLPNTYFIISSAHFSSSALWNVFSKVWLFVLYSLS